MHETPSDYQCADVDTSHSILNDAATTTFDYGFASRVDFKKAEENAKQLFSLKQKILLSIAFIILVTLSFLKTSITAYSFLIITNFLYILIITLRVLIILIGKKNMTCRNLSNLIDEYELPGYAILVPLYKEMDVVKQLIKNLEDLDYPQYKLQILIILEEDDIQTQAVLNNIQLQKHFKIIVVPSSYPQTKPKACNYALKHVTQDYIVVFDAEDKPEALQLRKSVNQFIGSEHKSICCQSILSYFNYNENFLTQMFSIEYAILFERILPALAHLNLPIPLGGTSNHFRTDDLRRLGGWDSYNVTEDADLGIKCAKAGFKTMILSSFTEEEATITIRAWIKQRSRWIKGFIQTYFVHMREPIKLLKVLGLRGFITFNLMFGVCNLLYVLSPIVLIIMYLVSSEAIIFNTDEMVFITYLNTISLIIGTLSIAWSAFEIRKNNSKFKVIKLWWLYPLYIALLPVASFLAIYQLFTKLHFWEKTKHGVSVVKSHS